MPDQDEVLNIVKTAILQDPTITDPNGIVLSVDRKGSLFKKETVVRLDGSVQFEAEIPKVEEIVRRKLPQVAIENNLHA